MIDLKDRHIFVAGGSRGIGAATARMAAKAGARVSVNYHSRAEAAEDLVEEIRSSGGKALALRADISQEGAISKAMDEAAWEFGPLRGLVVSAGVFESGVLEEMTADFWDRTMAVNVRGTFLAVQAAAKHMRAQG